ARRHRRDRRRRHVEVHGDRARGLHAGLLPAQAAAARLGPARGTAADGPGRDAAARQRDGDAEHRAVSAARPTAHARDGYPHFCEITTRWMDNDAYRHVNNVVYYSFFDTAVNR